MEDIAFKGTETVRVFVAKQDIGAGTTGDTAAQQGLIESRTVPAKVRPARAITSLAQISGQIATVPLFQDEIIVADRFKPPGEGLLNALPIPEGKQAVSVAIAGAPAVGGFVQPGDQVSLIVQTTNRTSSGTPVTGGAAGQLTKYLMQNLDVIAVGARVVTSGTTPPAGTDPAQQQQVAGIFTFSVTPAQAEKLVFAALNTTMYFTLLPPKSKPVTTGGRTFANLFR